MQGKSPSVASGDEEECEEESSSGSESEGSDSSTDVEEVLGLEEPEVGGANTWEGAASSSLPLPPSPSCLPPPSFPLLPLSPGDPPLG